jgi:hypothetical protein
MEAQPVDDLVDRLALGAEGDPDQIEVLRRDAGDGGAVRLVVRHAKTLAARSG